MYSNRSREVSVWHHQQIDGVINLGNSDDPVCEEQYPWRRNTADDEATLRMAANTSQYSTDSDVDINIAKDLRRNVNMVDMNLGHTMSEGRGIRNKDTSLMESQSQTEVSDACDTIVGNNQNLANEAISSSQFVSNLNLEDKRPNLDRGSKSATPKTRKPKLTTGSLRSNRPSRSPSPSPPRRNSANSSSISHQSANAVNVFAHPSGLSANSIELRGTDYHYQ